MSSGRPPRSRPRDGQRKSPGPWRRTGLLIRGWRRLHELGVHENTVSNAERRGSASHDDLRRLAAARQVNLHWLLTGQGAMRLADADASLLQETLGLALADALRAALGPRYSGVPLAVRAKVIRASATYLRAIGVTEASLPQPDALARLVKLTLDVMRRGE